MKIVSFWFFGYEVILFVMLIRRVELLYNHISLQQNTFEEKNLFQYIRDALQTAIVGRRSDVEQVAKKGIDTRVAENGVLRIALLEVGTYSTERHLHVETGVVEPVHSQRANGFVTNDPSAVGIDDDVANVGVTFKTQVGWHFVFAPHMYVGHLLQCLVHFLLISLFGPHVGGKITLDAFQPIALNIVERVDKMVLINACHSMVGQDDEVDAIVDRKRL